MLMAGEGKGEGGGWRPTLPFGFEFGFNPEVFWNCNSVEETIPERKIVFRITPI